MARKISKLKSDDVLRFLDHVGGADTSEIAENFGVTDTVAQNTVAEMSNDDLIDLADGQWVLLVEAPKDEARERLEYATRVAESQEPGAQHLHPMPEARPQDIKEGVQRIMDKVKPEHKAETPVIAADGTAVTVPVDPENDPQGARRELDASKGKRLIAEDVIKVKTAPQTLANKLKAMHDDTEHDSSIDKHGLALEAPDSVPAVPEGVNSNVWHLAHSAVTQTARDWWAEKAERQINAHKNNQPENAPF
jgi:hypothetical protein